MIKNLNFKKNIGRFLGKAHKFSGTEEINPQRDWKTILTVFTAISFMVIVFSSYLYWRIGSGGFFIISSKEELPIETIDRSELKAIIKFYEAKSQSFQKLKSEKLEVIDPSL